MCTYSDLYSNKADIQLARTSTSNLTQKLTTIESIVLKQDSRHLPAHKKPSTPSSLQPHVVLLASSNSAIIYPVYLSFIQNHGLEKIHYTGTKQERKVLCAGRSHRHECTPWGTWLGLL